VQVVEGLGGDTPVRVKQPSEEAIDQALVGQYQRLSVSREAESGEPLGPDIYRSLQIAQLKAELSSGGAKTTHVLALDTDIRLEKASHPLGTPASHQEWFDNLLSMKGEYILISTAVALASTGGHPTVSDQVAMRIKLKDFNLNEVLKIIPEDDVVGKVAGGFDFADPRAVEFIDASRPVWVDRVFFHSPGFDPREQLRRSVSMPFTAIQQMMGGYYKGAPSELIKWVLFKGLRDWKLP
jgi:predicted house-cleaning NTP pyrophosphatase (Maf/HAM1 superfamily)